MHAVDLRVHMAIDEKEILPSIIGEIDKGISPTHVALCTPGDSRGNRCICEVHSRVFAIEVSVINIKMGEEEGHSGGVQIVAQGYAHVGLLRPILAGCYAGQQCDILELALAVALI